MSAAGIFIWTISCQILQAAYTGVRDKYQFAGISAHVFSFQAEKVSVFIEFNGKLPAEGCAGALIRYFQSYHICMDFIQIHKNASLVLI